ncbi:MAG: Ig-like domain repeat protein, partial [Terracidiphilus sp.]
SPVVNLTVTPALLVPTVAVNPSASSITPAQLLTVAIAVNGTTGGATPTGTISLASGSFVAQQALAGGAASFTVAAGALNSGPDTLTATYSGDGNYATAMATASVNVAPVGMTIPPPPSVSPGASATATATITASGDYSGTLNLKCSLTSSPPGANSLPTCALNPTGINVAAGGNGTTTLTVNTTAASTTALAHPFRQFPFVFGGEGAVLAVALFFAVPSRPRRWISMAILTAVGVVACTLGCGGNGGQTTGSNTPATTAGSYVFTVTGTDSSNASITVSTTVSIVVQ